MPDPDSRLPFVKLSYGTKELAQLTGLHPKTIARYLKQGVIGSIFAGRKRLVPYWAVEEFLRTGGPSRGK